MHQTIPCINLITASLDLHFNTKISDPEEEDHVIIFTFQSNPEPTSGHWIVEEQVIPFGYKNGSFQSSEVIKLIQGIV
jgi:hypothetical protein